jgi:hypothetical protein
MKFLRAIVCVALLALQLSPALGYFRGFVAGPTANSQVSPNGSDFPFINTVKSGASKWTYANNTGDLKPEEVDANGSPLSTGTWTGQTGAKISIPTPTQMEYPGHLVMLWTGQGNPNIGPNGSGSARLVSCTGGTGSNFGGGNVKCDNTACSTFTGSIAGTTLTVTAAPTGTNCGLGQGMPISWGGNGGVSTFDTPTIIISSGSTCGPNTCYTVNISQTVTSTTMLGGGRLEMNLATPYGTYSVNTNTPDIYTLTLTSTGTGTQNFSHFALININDENNFQNSATPCGNGKACIVSSIFKSRIQTQGNFAVIRDLDWTEANVTSCSVWATRNSPNYYAYSTNEIRNAASGTTTYTAGGHTYTIPVPGQYVNSGGTGASGGTISYTTDTYSVTLGSGNFVDKQTFLFLPPSTGTTSSQIALNGNTAVPLLTGYGGSGPAVPTAGKVITGVYDAVLGGVLTFNGNTTGTKGGMQCGMPPEVFVEINAELKTAPWHVLPYLALDPMTDWVSQYATYVKNNYSSPLTRFEVTNEPFNCAAGPLNAFYLSFKSNKYIAEDSAWTNTTIFCGPGGSNEDEIGKMSSTVGQDLTSTLGSGNFELLVPTQSFGTPSQWAHILTSQAYVNQTIAPTQTGYSQTQAYQYATRISLNDYTNTGLEWQNATSNGSSLVGLATGYAYCYYFYSTSTACQSSFASQAAVMTAYMNTSTASTCGGELCSWSSVGNWPTTIQAWQTAAAVCLTGSTRPGNCTLNQTKFAMGYEGGYAPHSLASSGNRNIGPINTSGDAFQSIAGAATSGSNTNLIVHNNGCVVGQTVTLSGLVGGTWSTGAGSYVVQSVSGDQCVINLNSASLGTFGTGSTTASAGWTTASTSIQVASCSGISANQRVSDTTTGKYIGIVSPPPSAGCSGTTLSLSNYPAFNAGSNGDTITFVASSAIATYTGSFNWLLYLISASYTAPELNTLVGTLYASMSSAGMAFPSQYQLSNAGNLLGDEWEVFASDIYGYFPLAKCTSCTIASTTFTLGGTITGQFTTGQTLIGAGITGIGTGAGSNTILGACTAIGSNVCGTTAGDTFALNQASTVSSGETMTGNIAPGLAGSGTVSPVRAFHAICNWNGNGGAC